MLDATSRVGRQNRKAAPQLVGISLAYFMVLLDTTGLALAEPSIIQSLHTSVSGVGWTTTIYTMTLASTLVLAGSVSDRVGAYKVFIAGVAGFGVASLGCALAPTLLALLVFRALLGFFAAATIPSSLILIGSLYPDTAPRAAAIRAWAAISGMAMAAGALGGGLLISLQGWRAVFLVNPPIALIVLLVCRFPIASARHAKPISWLPHLGLASTLATTTLAITEVGRANWSSALAYGLTAGVFGYATVATNRVSPTPLVPAPLRGSRRMWAAFGGGAAINYALTTVIFSVPLQEGGSVRTTGIKLLPMTVLLAFNPLLTGRLVARFGSLTTIRMGYASFTLGLCAIAVGNARPELEALSVIGLILSGLAVSWSLPALTAYAVDIADPQAVGSVGGILNASRQVGATLAAAATSAILSHGQAFPATMAPYLIAAGGCSMGLVSLSERTTRTRRTHRQAKRPASPL
jgi:DHA2 family methylenomycin A resistance protein-like MFS transporter